MKKEKFKMALSKTVVYPNGLEATYHRISWFNFTLLPDVQETASDDLGGIVTYEPESGYYVRLLVSSYISKEIRDKGESYHVDNKEYFFEIKSVDLAKADVMSILYDKLKEYPEFEGAIDC
jgi:hypothetical protein